MADEKCKAVGLKRGEDYIGVCCVFYCHDGQGRILLHKRSQNCRDEQGRWDCGGGSLEHGETWEQSLRREIKEEFCVEPKRVELLRAENVLRDNDGVPSHWIALIHLVEVDPGQVKNGDPDKIEDLDWYHIDEFPEPLHSAVPGRHEYIKDHINKNL